MARQLILSTALLLLATGCASYTPSSAPVPASMSDAEMISVGDYAASVDPYVDPYRQEAVFNADLQAAGLLAMQVVARNKSDRPARVRRTDMMLTLPHGRRISPLSAHLAATHVGEEGSVIGMTLAFGIIGGLAASSAEDTARGARIADYQTKEFKDVTLGANESAHGFVFFMPPPGTGVFSEAALDIRFVDVETAKSQVVSLRTKRLAFAGAEAGGSAAAHEVRKLAVACAESADGTKPWVGDWSARNGDAFIRMNITGQELKGHLKTSVTTFPFSGGVSDTGYIRVRINGRGHWDGAGLGGKFPLVQLHSNGRSFGRLDGRKFRLCG